MESSWEDSVQGWVPHRSMLHAQPQIRFRHHQEHKQMYQQGKQQPARKNQTVKHNSPMMPHDLCLSARFKLVYGKDE